MAVRTLHATTEARLASLTSELHDSWIELPADCESPTPHTLRMSGRLEFGDVRLLRAFGPFVRVEESKPRLEVAVEGVTSVAVEDSAEVGGLILAGIQYNEAAGTLRIEGATPATVTLTVTSLSVTAAISDEVAEKHERWRLRSRLPSEAA